MAAVLEAPAHTRMLLYDKDHCWQYDIRINNLEEDLKRSRLTLQESQALTVDDFLFGYVRSEERETCDELTTFIERHEWLGKMPNRPTHRFAAFYAKTGEIAGAIVMAIPNTFSQVLGEQYKNREKLVSRGACISWSPKCLGSWLIMHSIRWMAKNTDFRVFSAYSDPDARELGTIYQACNFYYLGKGSGGNRMFFDPTRPHIGWFGERNFRHRSKYNMYAEALGIDPKLWKSWQSRWRPDWTKVPPEIKQQIKEEERKYRESCVERVVPAKHKYCYILGKTNGETRRLRNLFETLNPDLVGLPYPKDRCSDVSRHI